MQSGRCGRGSGLCGRGKRGKALVLALAFPRTVSPSVSLSRSSTERDHRTFHSAVVEFAIPGVVRRRDVEDDEFHRRERLVCRRQASSIPSCAMEFASMDSEIMGETDGESDAASDFDADEHQKYASNILPSIPTLALLTSLCHMMSRSDDGDEGGGDGDAAADGRAAGGGAAAGADQREARQPKRKRRAWSCSHAMQEHVVALRRRFDTDARAVLSQGGGGWVVEPPDALLARVARVGGRPAVPQPRDFQLHGWGAWVPERLFPTLVSAPPCPSCGQLDVLVATAVWRRRGPRRVIGGRTGQWFLDSKRYICNADGTVFFATHPGSVSKLPPLAQQAFGVILNRRSAVDVDAAERVVRWWKEPIPSSRIAAILNDDT